MRQCAAIAVTTAVLFLAASCDFSPLAPFEGFEGGNGAKLTGRFQGGTTVAASSTLRAQSELAAASSADALAAVVFDRNGNELGRVKVVDGAFTLRGLPDRFVLVFQDQNGNRVGEPMTFDGVKPNQEIDIIVELLDGEVVLIDEKRTGIDHQGSQGVEIEGRAQNIVVGSNPMTGSLNVNGFHVLSRAAETSIRKGNRSLTLNDLRSGDRVHVRGVFEGENVLAHEIKLQEEDDSTRPPSACNVRDPAKPNHILVCHKGKTLSVSPDAWSGHQGHGDTCGPCGG